MIGSEEFWLLAHSKGFDFKCQLVAANELDQLSLQ